MTAEQLEELLRDAYGDDQKKWEAAWYKLRLNCDHLARRVIAADGLLKVVEAMGDASISDEQFNHMRNVALTAYREASK